jgi:hypothetical protein
VPRSHRIEFGFQRDQCTQGYGKHSAHAQAGPGRHPSRNYSPAPASG